MIREQTVLEAAPGEKRRPSLQHAESQTVNMRRLLKSRDDRVTYSNSISSAPFCNLTRISCEISGLVSYITLLAAPVLCRGGARKLG